MRDINEPECPLCHIKPDLEYEPPECVSMQFNQMSPLQADSKTCDIFIAINNQLFYYTLDGECLKVAGFSSNIVGLSQDGEVLLLALENNQLVIYDWREGETLDEQCALQENGSMASKIKVEERNASIVVSGEKNGDIQIFRHK